MLPEDIEEFDPRDLPRWPLFPDRQEISTTSGHLEHHRVLARLAGLDEPTFVSAEHKPDHAALRDWFESETGERLPEVRTVREHARQHEKLHRYANRMLEPS